MKHKQTPRKGINLTGDRIAEFAEIREYFEEKVGPDKAAKLSDQRTLSLAFAAVRFLQMLERENGAKFVWDIEFATFRDHRQCCAMDCKCRQSDGPAPVIQLVPVGSPQA